VQSGAGAIPTFPFLPDSGAVRWIAASAIVTLHLDAAITLSGEMKTPQERGFSGA
jgi:hypothetical protein